MFSLGIAYDIEARTLTDALVQGFSFRAAGCDTTLAAQEFAPALADAIAQAVTQQLPLASIGPTFRYRFNEDLHTHERVTGVPGPLFSERSFTLGKAKFSMSVGYSFIDFRNLNGTDLDNIRSPGFFSVVLNNPLDRTLVEEVHTDNRVLRVFEAPSFGSKVRTKLDLQAHLVVLSLRYGITNNWDVSLSVPIVHTSLKVQNTLVRAVEESSPAAFLFMLDQQDQFVPFVVDQARNFVPSEQGTRGGFFDPATRQPVPDSDLRYIRARRPFRCTPSVCTKKAESATGIGDLTLRTQYRFWPTDQGGAAFGLDLQLPSGREENFHGTGETRVSSWLFFSQVFWDWFEPHLNVGTEFATGDIDRSSFLYAIGATIKAGKKLGVSIDIIGRSEFRKLSVRIPENGTFRAFVLDKEPDTCNENQECSITNRETIPFFSEEVKRNDRIDFAFGLRYVIGSSGSLFFGIITPLNNDGFRADFIPSGGIEYTF